MPEHTHGRRNRRPNHTARAPKAGRPTRSRTNHNRRRKAGSHKQHIHPSKFIHKAVPPVEEAPYQPTHSFADFGFGPELMYNIRTKGFTSPSPIQDQAIPVVRDGRDIIGLANTGTGKTAAFLLPILERMSGIMVRPSVLVMAPTRELAQQIHAEAQSFSRGLGVTAALVVGGESAERQIRQLKKRPHIIIGTPGRLKDLLQKRQLTLKNISVLVLDEADRMLDMGFLPDITAITKALPAERQSLFFSATITPEIEALTRKLLRDPRTVSVRTGDTSDHVEQDVIPTRDKAHKLEVLQGLLDNDQYQKVLVFGETKYGVQRLSDQLSKAGYQAVAIHGNKNQAQRQRALRDFKTEAARVLVATDVAARGLDIPNVTHVINYDTPQTYADYVHRIGRTGRGGKRGHAHTFIQEDK